MSTWNTSTPTAPGWYTASLERDAEVRRYWTGLLWSPPVYAEDLTPERMARTRAAVGESQAPEVEWLDEH
jgi:hypothetical protein